jgi:hypothetical protein
MDKLDLDGLEAKAGAEDDQRWLFSQFQAACATLRERSSYRRGPFLVDESDLPIASSGTQSEQPANPATMLALIARIRELEARDTKLSEATAQVLDGMGKNSLNCCGAAKAELRAALGEWPDLDFTLADAQAIIDACDYRKGTPNGTS